MTADPLDWRLEQYERMGFNNLQRVILANARDVNGVPLYWRTVEAVVDKLGLLAAYDLFAPEVAV
jgi:hypothetical protein